MNDDRFIEEIVTKFLLSTCRLRPQLTEQAVLGLVLCVDITRKVDDEEDHFIPLTSGSVAEFYIEPMLPHIGDVDTMHHRSSELAIPRGQSPPTQLPAEFHNYVMVSEIIDSHLPGFVYLPLRYLLTECDDDDKYNAVEYDEEMYAVIRRDIPAGHVSHGPAVMTTGPEWSLDKVPCMRCLSWPAQAADWPTRHRQYGWPDSATVDRVVNNGCDVVPVAHRQCRQHEWMSERQCRLSFSRAEIVLLNSWTPVQ